MNLYAFRLLQKLKTPADWTDKNECWEFTGYQHENGYCQFRIGNKVWQAHVAAYYLFRKIRLPRKTDKRRVIDHKCNNRKCCSPWHLQEVTQQENILRVEMQGHGVHSAAGSIKAAAKQLNKVFKDLNK